jgi:imidazolonepropionase
MKQVDTLILGCRQIITFSSGGHPVKGVLMNEPVVTNNGAIAISGGRIVDVANQDEILQEYTAKEVISAEGMLVLPGFVDAHTHPVFMHTREDEFAQRITGKSYVEIALSGGGIRSTIKSTRAADEQLLCDLAMKRIEKMISQGTTTLEAKSGYGLDTESELKQLRVIGKLSKMLPLTIVPTFLGAHEYPAEYKDNHQVYIDILCSEMIPAVAKQGIARYCDIFTEAHVFGIDESRMILNCAKRHGLKLKMHADEIEPIGGAELAAELGCVSADHLGAASDDGIEALKQSDVIPVLLPATLFSLRSKTYARGRTMIDRGMSVAIATDFNPGSCNCDSMPFTISLSCLQMGLSPQEALCAATINAACAIGLGDEVGTLEPGKLADFTIWDIPSLNFLPYHLGSSYLQSVYKQGKKIWQA